MPKVFTEQDRDIIRAKLLEAGLTRLEYKGYGSISIDEVAAEVGIAKGTFYSFFSSKELYFYEIMQFIKERNRREMQDVLQDSQSPEAVTSYLCRKYTQIKTVYDYFTPEEMKRIVRTIPEEAQKDDSAEFAEMICGALGVSAGEMKQETIVAMSNILAAAAANRSILRQDAYERAVSVFCRAMADYIFGGEVS